MPMIAGTTSVLDGTLSGELYAALTGIDSEVAADTFRRALCAAFGLAIATHANETIDESGAASPSLISRIMTSAATTAEGFFQATSTTAASLVTTSSVQMLAPRSGSVDEIHVWRFSSAGSESGGTMTLYINESAEATWSTGALADDAAVELSYVSGIRTFAARDRLAFSWTPTGGSRQSINMSALLNFA